MARRKRRVVRLVRRTLPKVFSCPQCGMVAIRINRETGGLASVACGSCGISVRLQISANKETIDIYNEFVDKYLLGQMTP